MNALITVFYVLLFALIILKSKYFLDDAIKPKWFAGIFLLKCLAGMFLMWLYYNEGIGGDMFAYFQNGQKLHSVFKTDPVSYFKILFGIDASSDGVLPYYNSLSLWFNNDVLANDNRSIIRLISIICFFSFGSFPVVITFFCFLSMTGLMAIFKFFKNFDQEKSNMIFLTVFLIPSALLWTSGIFKESYLIFILGLFLFVIRNLSVKKNILFNLFLATSLFFLLCFIKIYFIIALIPASVIVLIGKNKSLKHILAISLIVYVFIFTLAVLLSQIDTRFDVFKVLANKQYNFIEYGKFSRAKSQINIPVLNDNPVSFIKNTPVAIYNVLMRPYLWESKSIYWVFIAIENTFILVSIFWMLLKFKWNNKLSALSIALLLFSIVLFIIIGLTTPVLGSLVRYKAPVLIFFMMFFILNSKRQIKTIS